jgi:hypothetical protein
VRNHGGSKHHPYSPLEILAPEQKLAFLVYPWVSLGLAQKASKGRFGLPKRKKRNKKARKGGHLCGSSFSSKTISQRKKKHNILALEIGIHISRIKLKSRRYTGINGVEGDRT